MADDSKRTYCWPASFAIAAALTYVSLSPGLFMQSYGLDPLLFAGIFVVNAAGFGCAGRLMAPHPAAVMRMTLNATASAFTLFLAAFTSIGGIWSVEALLFVTLCALGRLTANAQIIATFGVSAGAIGLSWALYDGSPRAMAAVMLSCSALIGLTLRLRPATV